MGFFSNFKIATEADDITKRVSNQLRGENDDSDVAAAAGDDRDEDLTQVDNIYEEASAASDDTVDNPEQTDNPEDTDNTNDPTAAPEGEPEVTDDAQYDDGGSDETTDDQSSDETDAEGNKGLSSIFSDKNTLKETSAYLMNIIKGNLESLNTMIGRLDDLDDIKLVNTVISNLQHCEDYLSKMIVEKFASSTYEDLVTEYVTLKQIYTISIEMLDKHFNKDGKRKSPVNSRRISRVVV